MSLFDDSAFLAPFEESVVFTVSRTDSASVVEHATVRASVHVGESLSSDAGARIHAETGADVSLVVRRSCWPFAFKPRFGMVAEARGQKLTVKSANEDEVGWTLRCTADERAEAD